MFLYCDVTITVSVLVADIWNRAEPFHRELPVKPEDITIDEKLLASKADLFVARLRKPDKFGMKVWFAIDMANIYRTICPIS